VELTEPFRRVVLVVLDGLRVDAIDSFALPTLARLRSTAAYTVAHTVEPSVTWAVMTTLMTGVPPAQHGVVEERVHLPRPKVALHPLPATLAQEGLPTTAVLARIPALFRGVAAAIGRKLSVGHLRFVGAGAEDILHEAADRLADQRRGLIFLHWPDADREGHDHGWMSREYAEAARALDRALAELLRMLDGDPETLIIALADHGGGGVDPKDHMSDHPFDRQVPLFFTGSGVTRGDLGPHVSLLDVPATVLWALGVERPSSYVGAPLTQIVRGSPRAMPAASVA
jgi:membrane-anchored protein YejM (alkaline phosphatase superfamily)